MTIITIQTGSNPAMWMILYGIKNCDTVKKARKWLEQNSVSYQFHDFKTENISSETLKNWMKQIGLERVINKKSTTWRELPEAEQVLALSEKTAIALIQKNTSLIKRPVLVSEGKVLAFGFAEKEFERIFKPA